MWENNQKPDEKPHRSSEISQTVQIYRNTLNTQSGKFQNWEEGHFILFFLTLTSPLAWTVKSWSIMGVNSVPSCLQQTRLITKTLMQCSNLFGAALRTTVLSWVAWGRLLDSEPHPQPNLGSSEILSKGWGTLSKVKKLLKRWALLSLSSH